MKEKRIIHVEERLPILPTIPLSLQHLFAMFGSTVLVPFLLHVDPATALFMNGIGTLLYLTICKWRLPAYLGSSFAFISPVLAVCAVPGMTYGDAQGGFVVFGLSFIVLAVIVDKVGTKWIDVLFPPAAMGAIVAIIGLELAAGNDHVRLYGNGAGDDESNGHDYFHVHVGGYDSYQCAGTRFFRNYSYFNRRGCRVYSFLFYGRSRFFQGGCNAMVRVSDVL